MKGLIVTSTDLGSGKTYITTLLLKALRDRGVNAIGYLPVACGVRANARLLHAAGPKDVPLEDVNPIYLKNLTSPYVANLLEGTVLDMQLIQDKFLDLQKRYDLVLVEGIGGWETPLTGKERFSDYAAMLNLPTMLVTHNCPGMLNHTILTANAIAAKGIPCIGLAVNNIQVEWSTTALTNRGVIEDLTGLPILAELISGQDYIDELPVLEALGL